MHRFLFRSCRVPARAKLAFLLAGVLPAVLLPGAATYPEVQSLVVIGDSLSDTGRLGGVSASNGPVWVNYLATALGVPDPAAYDAVEAPDGTSFAYGGATAAVTGLPFPNGTVQLDEYLVDVLGGAAPPSDALIVVWLGQTDLTGADATPEATADAVFALLQRLANAGAKQLLVPEMLPLGMMPEHADEADLWNQQADAFNQRLAGLLPGLRTAFPDLLLIEARTTELFADLAAVPAAYGLSDLTTASEFSSEVDPADCLWWGLAQPTTVGHGILGQFAAREVASALGAGSASDLELSLQFTSGTVHVHVSGPALPLVTLEQSLDGVTWSVWQTLPSFDGMESLPVTLDASGRLFLRAR